MSGIRPDPRLAPHCCGCSRAPAGLTRRDFLASTGAAAGAFAFSGCTAALVAEQADAGAAPPRKPLVVKPVLIYDVPKRRNQTSWRNWGGIHTPEAANEEVARIQGELGKIKAGADFPLETLPVSSVLNGKQVAALEDLAKADAFIAYAAGGWMDALDVLLKTGKPLIVFLRHRSGPVYLWYEIISPRFLHQHGDQLATKGFDNDDVVVDSLDDLAWRLRALMGLKNTIGSTIVAIGGAGGWSKVDKPAPEYAREKFQLNIQNVPYPELKKLLVAAREDAKAVQSAKDRAAAYLRDPGVKLETERVFVENAFLLDHVFRAIMEKAGTRAITVNACMGTIMPIAETTACLTLSTLNDAGYMAFCESDFVAHPAGLLLTNISGRPHFMNDPTYPHHGVVTLAHCTGPRRMDGRNAEDVRIVTHFESDYGAAPKVEMKKGTVCTNIIPDFGFKKYFGFRGEIVDAPFLPICRDQVDVAYKIPDEKIALNMPGFHWEFCYGDCLKEFGYALKKTGIGWECLG
jgi:hypothetical protein